MKSELISVVVPVYNAASYLREALESLRNQTYGEFEAILVDDGSADASAAICREFCSADTRFRLISQRNAGVSAARNAGIEAAAGQWIAFMDADDLMMPDALEVLLDAVRGSGAGIAVGGYCRDADCRQQAGGAEISVVPSAEAIRIGLYQKRILNNPWGVLFSRDVFGGSQPLRFRQCRYEDLDLFYRAFERVVSVCIVDRTVYCYRDTPGSFINTWSASRLDVLDVTDRMVEHFRGKDTSLERAARDRRFSAHFNMLVEMERHGVDCPDQRRRCWDVIRGQRRAELMDKDVRLKNKLGALVSYLGIPAIRLLSRL